MQITTLTNLGLEIQGRGGLTPWLGPTLRGLLMRRFKTRVCQQPADEQPLRWRYCTGCPHRDSCDYGVIYEPENGSRLLVTAAAFPVPENVSPGVTIPLRITAIGSKAAEGIKTVLEILEHVGQNRGLETDEVPFAVLNREERPVVQELHPDELPPGLNTVPGSLPRLGVGLTAPLGLRTRKGAMKGRRVANTEPSFGDLFRNSASVLENLFASQGEMCPAGIEALQAAADGVPMIDHCYQSFRQTRKSGRRGESWDFDGVAGGAVYGPVPWSLIPWVYWGGQFHVGNHRSSGAGSWRLVMD